MSETELARKLGVSRKCLWERRQRFGIPRKKSTAEEDDEDVARPEARPAHMGQFTPPTPGPTVTFLFAHLPASVTFFTTY